LIIFRELQSTVDQLAIWPVADTWCHVLRDVWSYYIVQKPAYWYSIALIMSWYNLNIALLLLFILSSLKVWPKSMTLQTQQHTSGPLLI